MGKNIAAFSGGKDSCAMVMKMVEMGIDFEMLFTPAGNELPELFDHVRRMVELIGKPLVLPDNKPLDYWIKFFHALPNWKQRWCTRLIKIRPCIAYLEANPGSTLFVGLRADEEEREGLYGPYATYRYPLRELGMGLVDVQAYVKARGITIPRRTDCALCYGQRIAEWYRLWRHHPDKYAEGEAYEAETNHTFRSSRRDTWPASLADMRKEFERGRMPRGMKLDVIGDEQPEACRVCRL